MKYPDCTERDAWMPDLWHTQADQDSHQLNGNCLIAGLIKTQVPNTMDAVTDNVDASERGRTRALVL
jgi:hypothetical protein